MHFGENQLSPCSFGISPLPTAPPSLLQQTPVRPFTPCYGRCSLAMGSSHGFGSADRHHRALVTLAFARPPPVAGLGGDVQPLVGSYSKRHAITARGMRPACGSDCLDAVGFRLSFTPLAGVLFTVPSRYCALSVTWCRLPWRVVPPASHGIARVPWYSRCCAPRARAAHTGLSPSLARHPRRFWSRARTAEAQAGASRSLTTPLAQRLPPWHASGLGSGPFRSPLLRAVFRFLRLLRCFSSPGSPTRTTVRVCRSCDRRVAPFGDGRLIGWLRLPCPFAAGPRPSSAPRAEASPDRASCLAWSEVPRPGSYGTVRSSLCTWSGALSVRLAR